jgi:hypothetical protein
VSDASKVSDRVRLLAEQAGLERALKLAPEIVAGAAERGLKPFGKLPAGLTSTTTPAPVFDPAEYEPKK